MDCTILICSAISEKEPFPGAKKACLQVITVPEKWFVELTELGTKKSLLLSSLCAWADGGDMEKK